ncbi:hypothetical protein MRB53_037835 [Persea americana]|nr:hypothetical protein MRB53_037835 [Persea americana]
MIIPVRCFSCGKVVGDLWTRYMQLISGADSMKEEILLSSYVLTHVDLIEKLLRYNPAERDIIKPQGNFFFVLRGVDLSLRRLANLAKKHYHHLSLDFQRPQIVLVSDRHGREDMFQKH